LTQPTDPPFDLSINAETGIQYVPYVRKHLRAAHRILRPPLRDLSLALVGDGRMSALHKDFLGVPGPTDVLTFPLEEDRRGRVLAGEVVVCVPEARRQARARGLAVERELLLYALHGMLHLTGFDDRTDAGYRAMHRTEDMILSQLGVGQTFADAADEAGDRPRTPATGRTKSATTSSPKPSRRRRKGAR
jgi:rRNA maturation RNase YbeY